MRITKIMFENPQLFLKNIRNNFIFSGACDGSKEFRRRVPGSEVRRLYHRSSPDSQALGLFQVCVVLTQIFDIF